MMSPSRSLVPCKLWTSMLFCRPALPYSFCIPIKYYLPLRNMHCNENPNYVFPKIGIARPQSQFPHSCVVSDLYIPRIGPHGDGPQRMFMNEGCMIVWMYLLYCIHIFLQQNGQITRGNIKIDHRHMNVEIGWDWGRAIPFLGIFVSNLRFCIFTVWFSVDCPEYFRLLQSVLI